jgi:hypothetical protein
MTRNDFGQQPWRRATRHGSRRGCAGPTPATGRRAFFFLLPNLADDSDLDVYAFRLLAHYQRVAGLAGACAEPTARTAARCRMSPRRVVQARAELVEAGWITLAYSGPAGQQVPLVSMLDRMADNIARYSRPAPGSDTEAASPEMAEPSVPPPARAAAPARTTGRPPLHLVQAPPAPACRSPEPPDKTPEDTGTPPLTPHGPEPNHRQQGGGIGPIETTCPSPLPAPGTAAEEPARTLVAAFYQGLGAAPSTATLAMQRRDLAIARQLVGAGATPREAEAYARETSNLEGRLAPVDLRSFERERPAWLVRHRREERRRVDRTGLLPTWLDGADVRRTAPAPARPEAVPREPSAAARPSIATPASTHTELTGEHLGLALRVALLARPR